MKISLDVTDSELKRFAEEIQRRVHAGDFMPLQNPVDGISYKFIVGAEKYFEKIGITFSTLFGMKKEEPSTSKGKDSK